LLLPSAVAIVVLVLSLVEASAWLAMWCCCYVAVVLVVLVLLFAEASAWWAMWRCC
jgi:hypothetical protein